MVYLQIRSALKSIVFIIDKQVSKVGHEIVMFRINQPPKMKPMF